MGCLYILRSPNGKAYVGITSKTLEGRWAEHLQRVKEGRAQALQNAIRKYGADKFEARVLVIADDWDYLCDLERRAIAAFGTLSPKGYNLTAGGEGVVGRVHTEQAAANMSAGQKRRAQAPSEKGRLTRANKKWRESHPEEYEAARQSLAEKMRSPEVKAKLSAAARKQFESEEARKRASEAGRAAMSTPERREHMAKVSAALWEDPAYRAAQSEATRRAMAAPEVAEKVRAAAARRAADPNWRKKLSESKKGQGKGRTLPPEQKAKMAEARRLRWQDPAYRAKQAAARARRTARERKEK
jgi:group I intron endonuclease